MAFFEWEARFSVRISDIDQQHQRLIGLINQLYAAIERANRLATLGSVMSELETVSSVLDELIAYADYHFTTEEEYMREHAYPAYERHCQEHRLFADKAHAFKQRFQKKTRLSLEIVEFLRTWWQNHILDTDKQCGAFLYTRGLR